MAKTLEFSYIAEASWSNKTPVHTIFVYTEIEESNHNNEIGFYTFWMPLEISIVSLKAVGTAIGTTPYFKDKFVNIYKLDDVQGNTYYCEACKSFKITVDDLYMGDSKKS